MAENEKQVQGRLLLKESDFVKVEGPDGEELPSVPKHWGEDQLAAGAKKVGRGARSSGSSASGTGGGQQTPPANPPAATEPSGNASREDWAKYAAEVKGAKPEDLVDGDGKELGRDELKAKYGTPAQS